MTNLMPFYTSCSSNALTTTCLSTQKEVIIDYRKSRSGAPTHTLTHQQRKVPLCSHHWWPILVLLLQVLPVSFGSSRSLEGTLKASASSTTTESILTGDTPLVQIIANHLQFNQPLIMMLPPPCVTVWMKFLGLLPESFVLFDESVSFQKSSDLSECFQTWSSVLLC